MSEPNSGGVQEATRVSYSTMLLALLWQRTLRYGCFLFLLGVMGAYAGAGRPPVSKGANDWYTFHHNAAK